MARRFCIDYIEPPAAAVRAQRPRWLLYDRGALVHHGTREDCLAEARRRGARFGDITYSNAARRKLKRR